jgi:UDP-N-acetylmuramoyl-L-alanyl-D-glutamate--2,6-diaminopimelate ligase
VHVAWSVRGQRGRRINRYNAEAFAIWAPRLPLGRVVVSRSDDTVDDHNRVTDGEYRAFIGPLQRRSIAFESEPSLEHAIGRVLGAAAQGDLVLLLGAQGMDRGRDFARAWLAQNGDDLLSQVQKLQPQQRPHRARPDREEP